jgi:hypothetical protein
VTDLVVALRALLGEGGRIEVHVFGSGAAFVDVRHGGEFVVVEHLRGQFCADYHLCDERFGRGTVRDSAEETARDVAGLLGVAVDESALVSARGPGREARATARAAALVREGWVPAATDRTTAAHWAIAVDGRLFPLCERKLTRPLRETGRAVTCRICLEMNG